MSLSLFMVHDTIVNQRVYIYDKSQLENITKEQVMEMLKIAGLL